MTIVWNRKRIESDAEESRSRGQGGAYINLKDGEKMNGRFMPVAVPKGDAEAELYIRFGQHYLRDIELYVICPREPIVADSIPKAWTCPLCVLWKELRESKDPDDQEEAKKYNLSVRFMSNFKVAEGDMRIFRYSVKTQPKLVDLAFGTEYTDILDLKDGRDVEVRRKGASIDTDYMITPMKSTYTIPDSVLGDLHDLYAEIKVLEPAVIAGILKGNMPEDADYVTLRDLMIAKAVLGKDFSTATADGIRAAAAGQRAASSQPAGIVSRRSRQADSVVEEKAEQDDSVRKPTRAEAKRLIAFGDELGLDVDVDNPYETIASAILTEAVGTPMKKLSEDFSAWLEANGCDVDGKLVARAKEPAPAEPARSEELSEVEKQIQAVRDRRAAKKK